ncbi:MAG: hypothetical protein AAGA43_08885 [Bacteroidota bacterium]
MKTLKLHHTPLLQGDFKLGKRNLLFVFQVNCPGCFFYGFPLMEALHEKYASTISFLGLSTAFEDFEFNTQDNTKMLLENSTLIGETKKAFQERGLESYPQHIDLPIAMDVQTPREEFATAENIEFICSNVPGFDKAQASQKDDLKLRIKDYLNTNPLVPETFTLNQLRGTPSFVLFDHQQTVLEHWFGHKEYHDVEQRIEKWLN